ncbi:MAG: type II toxin-antitoxin system PemK/MazF family toxin [Oscillatoriaceae cyanobacterium Prado104]|jgi:hypothetical protein|nr:type II toxin-antitoxin system PemK/MazF family toxin [Oscillatoriaceae cyanobacterium Prado104]
MTIGRGEIWIANLDPTQGSEQAGVRPTIIFQNDTISRYTTTVISIPLSTNLWRNSPYKLEIITWQPADERQTNSRFADRLTNDIKSGRSLDFSSRFGGNCAIERLNYQEAIELYEFSGRSLNFGKSAIDLCYNYIKRGAIDNRNNSLKSQ